MEGSLSWLGSTLSFWVWKPTSGSGSICSSTVSNSFSCCKFCSWRFREGFQNFWFWGSRFLGLGGERVSSLRGELGEVGDLLAVGWIWGRCASCVRSILNWIGECYRSCLVLSGQGNYNWIVILLRFAKAVSWIDEMGLVLVQFARKQPSHQETIRNNPIKDVSYQKASWEMDMSLNSHWKSESHLFEIDEERVHTMVHSKIKCTQNDLHNFVSNE